MLDINKHWDGHVHGIKNVPPSYTQLMPNYIAPCKLRCIHGANRHGYTLCQFKGKWVVAGMEKIVMLVLLDDQNSTKNKHKPDRFLKPVRFANWNN